MDCVIFFWNFFKAIHFIRTPYYTYCVVGRICKPPKHGELGTVWPNICLPAKWLKHLWKISLDWISSLQWWFEPNLRWVSARRAIFAESPPTTHQHPLSNFCTCQILPQIKSQILSSKLVKVRSWHIFNPLYPVLLPLHPVLPPTQLGKPSFNKPRLLWEKFHKIYFLS